MNVTQKAFYEEDELFFSEGSINSLQAEGAAYITSILEHFTDSTHPMQINSIVARLAEYPFELTTDRKYVSNVVSDPAMEILGIHYSRNRGAWYEVERREAAYVKCNNLEEAA